MILEILCFGVTIYLGSLFYRQHYPWCFFCFKYDKITNLIVIDPPSISYESILFTHLCEDCYREYKNGYKQSSDKKTELERLKFINENKLILKTMGLRPYPEELKESRRISILESVQLSNEINNS